MKPIFYNKLGHPVFDAHNPDGKIKNIENTLDELDVMVNKKQLIRTILFDYALWFTFGFLVAIIFF